MPRPTDVGSVGERLYKSLAPFAAGDAAHGWALLVFLGAIGKMTQGAVDLSFEENGHGGWSILFDLDAVPDDALPWLAQFVGVTIPPAATPADARNLIEGTAGWSRGTVPAMIAAGKLHLTGTKSLIFRERFGGAYKLTVVTYTAETPNTAQTLADLLTQKPAGIKLTLNVLNGQDYQTLFTARPNYQSVFTFYTTYGGVLTGVAGT